MPKGILQAYKSFRENHEVRNSLAAGLGEPYKRQTSVPRGDPWSMMVTALLLRPWFVQMKHLAVEPRLLADDLQVISTGTRHAEHFQHAFDKTHERLEDLGAKLAPTKSMTFSSELATRSWLRTHRWRRLGKVVKVVTDCRDIGAHFNATNGIRRGTTLSTRMKETRSRRPG